MKILFVTSSSIQGGAQKHIRDMFRSFSRMGHDVYLVAPSGWLTDELHVYEEKLILVKACLKNVPVLQQVYEEIKPDIINTFILSGGVFGTLAWKKKKYGKIFITVNNPVIYPGISIIKRGFFPFLYRWMSRYASAFLVKADAVRDEVAKIIKNQKPVISIKNGIDFNIFDKDRNYPDIRAALGIKQEDVVITNVAALDVRKGQEYLIKAAVELRTQYPIHIFLVGEGNDEDKLKVLVRTYQAEEYIHFLGRRKDINCILASTDIFVLPSIHEGLPNALMEAMAMGLPCIATDVGGVRQLIEDGIDGIVISSKSVCGIVEGVKSLLSHPELAEKLEDSAFQRMWKQYRQEAVSRELDEIYKRY